MKPKRPNSAAPSKRKANRRFAEARCYAERPAIPPLPPATGSAVRVPRSISVCPECSGDLECQMTTPDIRDLAVDCVNDNAAFFTPGPEGDHRYWQAEWEPVIEKLKAKILADGGTLEDYRRAINTAFENVRKENKLRG